MTTHNFTISDKKKKKRNTERSNWTFKSSVGGLKTAWWVIALASCLTAWVQSLGPLGRKELTPKSRAFTPARQLWRVRAPPPQMKSVGGNIKASHTLKAEK